MNEQSVKGILSSCGPLTGRELRDESRMEELALWRLCRRDPEIITSVIGRRYLRLDRNVEGYARLSPSIKREFLTYTVCGLNKDHRELGDKSFELWKKIKKISRDKMIFARDAMLRSIGECAQPDLPEKVLFLIAGDIVYEMAHLEPRPESSTGRLVKGSDLDIIIIAEDDFPDDRLKNLDQAVHREKYLCLIRQECREEIDYIIKDLEKASFQMAFDSFEHMVASKILYEGKWLLGSRTIFDRVKNLLEKNGIPAKIASLEEKAAVLRKQAESCLLDGGEELNEEESLKLFFTREEADEIF